MPFSPQGVYSQVAKIGSIHTHKRLVNHKSLSTTAVPGLLSANQKFQICPALNYRTGQSLWDKVVKAISGESRGQELDSHPLQGGQVALAKRYGQRQRRVVILACRGPESTPLTMVEQMFHC